MYNTSHGTPSLQQLCQACDEQHLKEHGPCPPHVYVIPDASVAVRNRDDPVPALHKLGSAVLGDVVITSLAAAEEARPSFRTSGLAQAHNLHAAMVHAGHRRWPVVLNSRSVVAL